MIILQQTIAYVLGDFAYAIPNDFIFGYILNTLKVLFFAFILCIHFGAAFSLFVFATAVLLADYLFYLTLSYPADDEEYSEEDDDQPL